MSAPERITNYTAKRDILKNSFGNICPIILEKEDRIVYATELHHAKVHNTKTNRSLYPRLIHSLLNLYFVSNIGNTNYTSWGKCTENQAKQLESFLRRNPEVSKWLNNPSIPIPYNHISQVLKSDRDRDCEYDSIAYYEILDKLIIFSGIDH